MVNGLCAIVGRPMMMMVVLCCGHSSSVVDETRKVYTKHVCAYLCVAECVCVGGLMVASNKFAYDFYIRRVAYGNVAVRPACGQTQIGDVFFRGQAVCWLALNRTYLALGVMWKNTPHLLGEVAGRWRT